MNVTNLLQENAFKTKTPYFPEKQRKIQEKKTLKIWTYAAVKITNRHVTKLKVGSHLS